MPIVVACHEPSYILSLALANVGLVHSVILSLHCILIISFNHYQAAICWYPWNISKQICELKLRTIYLYKHFPKKYTSTLVLIYLYMHLHTKGILQYGLESYNLTPLSPLMSDVEYIFHEITNHAFGIQHVWYSSRNAAILLKNLHIIFSSIKEF